MQYFRKIVGRDKSVNVDNCFGPSHRFLYLLFLSSPWLILKHQKSQPALNHRGLWVGGLVWHVAPLVAQFTSVAVKALVKGQAQGLVIIT